MSSIICATRAGEGSRAVQWEAIRQAKEEGHHLVFLYVIETKQLDPIDEPMRPFVKAELYWLAKTMLRIAERRALSAGVNAELAIREGNIREEIHRIVVSSDADCLLLGAPRHRNINEFGREEIEVFARSIEESNNIQVKIIRPAVISPTEESDLPRSTK